MTLSGLVVLVVVFLVCAADGYLNRVYSKQDESSLIGLIVDSQSEKHKSKWFFENSLSSTYYATDALSRLQHDIPNSQQLCQTLQSYKPSNWEELHHVVMTRSKMHDCLNSVTDKTKSKLVNGMESTKLSQVYYAVDAVSALKELDLFDTSNIDVSTILSHIATFQSTKDSLFTETAKSSSSSVYRSSLALTATVKLLSMCEDEYLIGHWDSIGQILKSFALGSKALFGKFDGNSDFLSYASSLTATSFVVESLNSFVGKMKELQELTKKDTDDAELSHILSDFDDPFGDSKYVEKLTRYVLSYIGNTNVVTSRHILNLMSIIENSVEFSQSRPMAITFGSNVFNSDGTLAGAGKSRSGLEIHVSNVFGERILTNSNMDRVVSLESSKEIYSKKQGPKGYFTLIDGSDNKGFEYDFGLNLLKHIENSDGSETTAVAPFGMFNLLIHINDDLLFPGKALSVRTDCKVLTKVSGVSFGAALAKDVDEGYKRAEYPNGRIEEKFEISPSQKAKFEMSVKSKQRPTFIGVQFVDWEGQVAAQVVPRRRQDKYSLSIDISKKAYSALREGHYTVNLLLSDALYQDGGILWENVVSFDALEEEEEADETDYEPVNDETPLWVAKEPIEHTFGSSHEVVPPGMTMVFSVLIWLPLLWLLTSLFAQQGIWFSCKDGSYLLSILFFFSLLAVASVLSIYWFSTNIFRAAGYLIAVSIPLYFIMYRILKTRLILRTSQKPKSD